MKRFLNWKILLLLIVLLAAFLRFYQLGNIPAGLTNDEANTGYDAYSILLTGKDQWGTFLPITNFIGFGDYPPPLYRYLSIIPIYFWGLNQFSVRYISALAGVLSVIAVYFLGKKLFNREIGLFSSLIFSVFPWAVGLSRVGIESNVAILFIIISLYFGLNNQPKLKLRNLSVSSFFLALSIYTYSAYILFSPLVLIIILFDNFYRTKFKSKEVLTPILIIIIALFPIFVFKSSASVRFSQIGLTTNINSIGLLDNLNTQIGQCQEQFKPIVCKIIDNKIVLFSGAFIKNYLSHFSLNFLYTNGTVTQYSILEERGLDYIYSSLLLFMGILFLIKENKNKKHSIILILLFLLSPIPDSLTGDGNFSRSSIMQPFIVLIDALGLFYLVTFLNSFKNIYFKRALFSLVSLVFVFGVCSFFITYITYFRNNYSIFSQYGYRDLMTNVAKDKGNYDRVYISSHLNDAKQYIYYLFYNKYDPKKYQTKRNISYSVAPSGWISIDRLENIYFISSTLTVEQDRSISGKKILIVSNPKDFPKSIKPVFVVKDRLGNMIFEAMNYSDLLEYNKAHKSLINETI